MSEEGRKSAASVCSKKSHHSKSSKGSVKSSASIAALNARAKAEAARTRAEFAKMEIEMKVKKAELKVEEVRLDATLQALKQQCDAEAAQAEAYVFEKAATDLKEESALGSAKVDSTERTHDYVKHQIILKADSSPLNNIEHNDTLANNCPIRATKTRTRPVYGHRICPSTPGCKQM